MTTNALRHFVEQAFERLGPDLEAGFPDCFDWTMLCRDTPAMVERHTEGRFEATDARSAHFVQDRASEVFRFVHVATLIVLSATDEDVTDPHGALVGLSTPPEDEAEERFAALARDTLDAVEASFEDEDVLLDERGSAIRALVERSWGFVFELLEESGLFERAEDEVDAVDLEAALPVLAALARLGAVLAAMRWAAVYPDADARSPS
jgi:hypothetical protein